MMNEKYKKRKMDDKEKSTNENLLLILHLPDKIIIEILSRLSSKSLLKLRCVSKHWNDLFNDPKLIDMIKNNFSIILRSGSDMYSIDNKTLSPSSSLLDDIDSRIKKINFPIVNNCSKISFLASCNGLFIIRTTQWRYFIFWNPSTGECCKSKPSPSDLFQADGSLYGRSAYGFGYDCKTDDHKIVCITSNSIFQRSEAMIYSLRSDSWKPYRQHIPWQLALRKPRYGVFCNGALHWLSSSRTLNALNMTNEFARGILPPKNPNLEKFGNTACIDVLDGFLCMLYCNINLGFEVWLMKDYGKKESWTKVYNIPKLTALEMGRLARLRRIKCLRTGEILLEVYYDSTNGGTREALVLYDPKNVTSTVLMHGDKTWTLNSASFHSYVN